MLSLMSNDYELNFYDHTWLLFTAAMKERLKAVNVGSLGAVLPTIG